MNQYNCRVLMVDNFDSFTFNIVQYLGELGCDVIVKRNDEIALSDIKQLNPDKIIISPGPCTPNEAGISMEVIRHFAGKLPILGVCLGHQSIGQVYGGRIVRAKEIMHGKTSLVYHDGTGVFKHLPNPYTATRYHSLVIESESLPESLHVTAWTQIESGERDEIMGVRHVDMNVEGVQFHPESILTEHGHALLENFVSGASA